jgi:hypothetical protein
LAEISDETQEFVMSTATTLLPMSLVKVALVVFLVLAMVVIVVVFIRNVRAKGFPAGESSSHLGQIRGAMPPTPRPDWAGREDDVDGEGPARRSRRV